MDFSVLFALDRRTNHCSNYTSAPHMRNLSTLETGRWCSRFVRSLARPQLHFSHWKLSPSSLLAFDFKSSIRPFAVQFSVYARRPLSLALFLLSNCCPSLSFESPSLLGPATANAFFLFFWVDRRVAFRLHSFRFARSNWALSGKSTGNAISSTFNSFSFYRNLFALHRNELRFLCQSFAVTTESK